MDLFCYAALLIKTSKSNSSMKLKRNGVTTVVTRKEIILGYNETVWFSTRAITNIISLHNLIDQYRVTYDSDGLMFVGHRDLESKPNMESQMHESSLNYYDLRKAHHPTFVNTVSENKQGFTKRQIKGEELA
jgi:hypothetical protein